MMIRVVGFLASVFSALAMVPYGAHLFALRNKIAMSRADYLVAQSVYSGWAWLSAELIPAMLINLLFAYVLRAQRPAFVLAALGCIAMAATLVIFFSSTYPANVATHNWTTAPENWQALRRRWEYSHAANAALAFASFCFTAAAALVSGRT
jgi:hypothetical protein